MTPYRIEMRITSEDVKREPLYTLTEYDRDGKILKQLNNISKEDAVKSVACLCGKFCIARGNGKS